MAILVINDNYFCRPVAGYGDGCRGCDAGQSWGHYHRGGLGSYVQRIPSETGDNHCPPPPALRLALPHHRPLICFRQSFMSTTGGPEDLTNDCSQASSEPETSKPATLQALLARARVLADDVVEENRVVVSADPDSEEAVECQRWARVVVQMLTQAAEIAVALTVWMGRRIHDAGSRWAA